MNNSHISIADKKVFRIGLGTNRIRNDEWSKKALKHAVSIGINFIDTASAYTAGTSERIIGETLTSYRNVLVATKGGMVSPDFHIDSRPETLNKQLEESLQKLQIQTIDLYFLHRVDPNVPMKESLLFLKQMQDAGKIKYIGLSDVSVAQIEEARTYVDVVAIENEYNITKRQHEDVLEYCEQKNLVFIPYFPLHFQITHQKVWDELQEKYQATEAQLALAWLLKRSPLMLPIPGSLSTIHLQENADAAKIVLSDKDFEALSQSAAA